MTRQNDAAAYSLGINRYPVKKLIKILGYSYKNAVELHVTKLQMMNKNLLIDGKIFIREFLIGLGQKITTDRFFLLLGGDSDLGFVVGDAGIGYIAWITYEDETDVVQTPFIDAWIEPLKAFLTDTGETGLFEKVN